MKKLENKPISMFSAETLDSIAMAEICGGATNNGCSNTQCTNVCINTSPACEIVTPINVNCSKC